MAIRPPRRLAGACPDSAADPVNIDSIPLALSYDDVLLVPRRSAVRSRADIDVSTRLTRDLRLAVPIVGANMDTVTEAPMAIALARCGGIGIIHRFLTVADQVGEVSRVKRAEALVIGDPRTIDPEAPLAEARRAMEAGGFSGLMVVDERGRVQGILTARDLLAGDDHAPVRTAMTPRERLLVGGPTTGADEAQRILSAARLEKLPLVDADDRLVGLITLRDLALHAARPQTTKDAEGRLAVGAAIGVRGDFIERAQELVGAGADALVQGLELVLRDTRRILEGHGVAPIDAAGQPFDPSLHEAVLTDEREDVPDETVVEELQKGYRIGERLLRPSMVKVARNAGPSA